MDLVVAMSYPFSFSLLSLPSHHFCLLEINNFSLENFQGLIALSHYHYAASLWRSTKKKGHPSRIFWLPQSDTWRCQESFSCCKEFSYWCRDWHKCRRPRPAQGDTQKYALKYRGIIVPNRSAIRKPVAGGDGARVALRCRVGELSLCKFSFRVFVFVSNA